jgi:steroid delta-isomerase
MASQPIPPVVSEYFAAITRMDPDAWTACFTEQATSYEPGASSPLQGHAALRQFLVGVLGAFSQLELAVDHAFSSGTRVAVMFTGRGKGKNGREVSFEGIDVFEIGRGGKIQMIWGYWDPAAMMAQLQGS